MKYENDIVLCMLYMTFILIDIFGNEKMTYKMTKNDWMNEMIKKRTMNKNDKYWHKWHKMTNEDNDSKMTEKKGGPLKMTSKEWKWTFYDNMNICKMTIKI